MGEDGGGGSEVEVASVVYTYSDVICEETQRTGLKYGRRTRTLAGLMGNTTLFTLVLECASFNWDYFEETP